MEYFFGAFTRNRYVAAPTGVSIDQSYTGISVGQELLVTATVSPANATDKTVTMVSSNTSILSVAPSGSGWAITGVSNGLTRLTATDSAGHTDYIDLMVVASGIVISMIPNRIIGVAPLSVHIDATGTTAAGATPRPFHDLLGRWNYGDEDVTTWAYGARPGQMKRNRDTGSIGAHVYETPGTYTVTHEVYDGVNWATATRTITVLDPATVYAGNKTICVSSTGLPVAGVGGVPAGAQCFQVSTVEAATAKITGADQRLLFKRGDTFVVTTTNYIPAYTGITVGAYGTGAKPLVDFQVATLNYGAFCCSSNDIRVMDIQFTTAMSQFQGTAPAGTYATRIMTTITDNILLLRLDGTHISSIAQFGGHYDFAVDCTLDQAGGGGGNVGMWYAVYGIGGAIIGNSITDCTRIEHNIRTHAASKTLFAHNLLTQPASGKHLLTIRGVDNAKNGLPGEEYTRYQIVSDNSFGSATQYGGTLQIAPEATNFNEPIADVIVEKNLFTGPLNLRPSSMTVDMGDGLTIRNNIALNLVPTATSDSFISLGHSNIAGSPSLSNCNIFNNSMYSEISTGYTFVATYPIKAPDPTGIRLVNNLAYAPYATKTAAGNGTRGTMLFTFGGIDVTSTYSTTDTQLKSTPPGWTTQPPAGVADFGLQAGSYGKDSGQAKPVWDDFFGTLRTGVPDMGAVTS